jgi:hypothetical protein
VFEGASAMYHYFVSFFVYPADFSNGFPFSNMGVEKRTPITTLEDVREIERQVEKMLVKEPGDSPRVIVQNYQLLRLE